MKKTYEAHKRLYYDDETEQWIKKQHTEAEFFFDDIDFNTDVCTSSQYRTSGCSSDDRPPVVDFDDEPEVDSLLEETDDEPPDGNMTVAVAT